MVRRQSSTRALSTLTLGLLTACFGTEQVEPEVGQVAAPIVNGSLADNVDLARFGLIDVPNCSGSAINANWIITAKHCPVQAGAAISFLGRLYQIDAVARHPGTAMYEDDMMLAHVSTDLLDWDGNVWFPESDLLGHTYVTEPHYIADNSVSMMCYGRSPDTFMPAEAWQYHYASFTAFRGSSDRLVELASAPNSGNSVTPGDSGGPCYRFDSGETVYVGIITYDGAEDRDGATSDGRITVLTQSKADWIKSIVDPD